MSLNQIIPLAIERYRRPPLRWEVLALQMLQAGLYVAQCQRGITMPLTRAQSALTHLTWPA